MGTSAGSKVPNTPFVTDSVLGNIVEAVASHFVNAEIKDFPYEDLNQAREWAAGQQQKGMESNQKIELW